MIKERTKRIRADMSKTFKSKESRFLNLSVTGSLDSAEDDMYIVFDVTLDVQGWLDDP
jgi:hypothetical protein